MNTDDLLLDVDPLERLRQRRSAKWQTYPRDVLPLTVAEMDFALAPAVSAALRDAVERSDAGYAMAVPGLGQAVAAFAARRWSWDIDPASVTAVTDVGVGVVELLRALTRPGDAVVISPPVYPPFFDWVPEAGARILEVPLAERDGRQRLDLDGLERAFAAHPAAYVLCNPQNPVGTVHSPEELEALVRLARIYRVILISDEIHAPLVLPGATFTPLLTVRGAVAAYTEGDAWLDQLLRTLDHRRRVLADLLAEQLSAISWRPPEATYLAWLDCRGMGPDNEARELFLRNGKVALEPGLRFGAPGAGYARLNFATSVDILEQAAKGMARAIAG